MEPDESESISTKMKRKPAVDYKILEKDQEMLDMKKLWNSKYYILQNKTEHSCVSNLHPMVPALCL